MNPSRSYFGPGCIEMDKAGKGGFGGMLWMEYVKRSQQGRCGNGKGRIGHRISTPIGLLEHSILKTGR